MLYFQNLVVPRPEGRLHIIKKMHNEIGRFGGTRTFSKVKQCFFWHDRTNFIIKFVKTCDKFQLAKRIDNLQFGVEDMKSTPICDLFYQVALDTSRPLLETFNGNKYVLVAIDHYSKWCEVTQKGIMMQ